MRKFAMKYVLVQDVGAGSARVITSETANARGFHENYVDEFDTLAEAEAAREELRGQTVYAVFWNRGEARGYVSAEDNLSGNWRGSRDGFYSCVSEHETQESAEMALSDLYK